MGSTVYAPRQDGNARFSTLQVQLTENALITRAVVVDSNGKFYYSNSGGGGSGTVTSVSVVSANGLAGTVATSTTTPAITLSTTITGILKGNGTAISAATPGTDYITITAGTASWATNALTASYFIGSVTSASYAGTASVLLGSVQSASYASTASLALNFITSSVTSASYAATASSADTFNVRTSATASNLLVTNTITAQTLIVQTITSSVEYSSGSNIFGSKLTDTQQFTGSVSISGSLTIPNLTPGSVIFAGTNGILSQSNSNLFWDNANGRLGVGIATPSNALHVVGAVRGTTLLAATSATIGSTTTANASSVLDLISTTKGLLPPRTNLTSNIATPAQGLITYLTGSTNEGLYYYDSGSIKNWTRLLNDTGSQSITGSLTATSFTGSLLGTAATASYFNGSVTSASYAGTASVLLGSVQSASYAATASYFITSSITSASYSATASYFITSSVTSASYASTASWALNFITSSVTSASYASTASYFITSSITSASYASTSSWALNFLTSSVTSASYALTASYFVTSSVTSASYASTASLALNFITSSVTSASYASTASWALNFITSSVTSASYASSSLSASYAANGGVTQIVAGTNITISPSTGIGAVTINSIGGTSGAGTNTTASFSNLSTWTFAHGLNSVYPIIQTLDSNGNQIIPQNIALTNANTATITFPTAESGIAIASLGGVGTNAATASTVASVGSYGTINIGANNNQGSIVVNGSNTIGGSGYIDFLKVTNSAAGAIFPNKTFRTNISGGIEIINSSYGGNLFTLTEQGDINLSGSLTMGNRPAFRVIGTGPAISATTVISGSAVSVDYNQGNAYNSTNGVFTATYAGLYQVNIVARTNSNANPGINQVIVRKTAVIGGTLTTQIMVEWGINTSANHIGGSTITKLAVGDTLQAIVTAGTISFDSNDNFSVAYIG